MTKFHHPAIARARAILEDLSATDREMQFAFEVHRIMWPSGVFCPARAFADLEMAEDWLDYPEHAPLQIWPVPFDGRHLPLMSFYGEA